MTTTTETIPVKLRHVEREAMVLKLARDTAALAARIAEAASEVDTDPAAVAGVAVKLSGLRADLVSLVFGAELLASVLKAEANG